MKYEEFILLRDFATESGEQSNIISWQLGKLYYNSGEYSAAQYFFIDCAENAPDKLLSYECKMMASLCFRSQGNKESYRLSLIDDAIEMYPLRPEAYYLKSRYFLDNRMYQECIDCIEKAKSSCYYIDAGNGRNDQTTIISWSIEYFGKTHFTFVEGLAHYYLGDVSGSLKYFESIESDAAKDLPVHDYNEYVSIYSGIN